LWFDGRVDEAVDFYTSVFADAEVVSLSRQGEAVLTAVIRLNGQEIMLLNGGPAFTLSPAVSLVVTCDTQEGIDYYWGVLSGGGHEEQCGWLVDQFGLSWQIVPAALGELMQAGDPAQAERVMQALLGMVKLDIAALQAAYAG
jgi:predicted 3-demethylubiquinone-9 3-methyltransferase (glyoxalase superfamily)